MHNFSLLHDDVMDRDLIRRGRATVWSVWGETNAILLGDALHALSGRVLAEFYEPTVAAPALMKLESSCMALCLGQFEDCNFEARSTVSPEAYLRMAGGKTASLIGCACALGALSAGASTSVVQAMERFGFQLGVAFQVVDDMMGVWGNAALAGKSVGNDLARRKSTFPVVVAMNSQSAAAAELAELYRSTAPMTAADIARATELVEAAGGRRIAQQCANESITAAMEALPDFLHSTELIALAQFIVDRDW